MGGIGNPKCHQFRMEDRCLYLTTSFVDPAKMAPQNPSPDPKVFTLILTSEPPNPAEQYDASLGSLASSGTPIVHGQWYTIKKDTAETGTAGIPVPKLADFPTPQAFADAMQAWTRQMIQRLAELNPEHAPETIPENHLEALRLLVELQRHDQSRQVPHSIRLMVAWPGKQAAEL